MIYTDTHTHWDKAVKDVEMYLNNAYNKTTEGTPYELLHGYTPKLTNSMVQKFGLNSTACWDPRVAQQEARKRICEKLKVMRQSTITTHVLRMWCSTLERFWQCPPNRRSVKTTGEMQGPFASTLSAP